MKCPKCCGPMASGFSSASSPISWITKDQFRSLVFVDQDLAEVGLKMILPSKGEYFVTNHCSVCKVVITDYSSRMDRKAVEALTGSAYGIA